MFTVRRKTRAEYDAIPVKDPQIFYIVLETDETFSLYLGEEPLKTLPDTNKLNFVSLSTTTASATPAKTTVEQVQFSPNVLYLVRFQEGNSVANTTLNGTPILLGTSAVSTTTFTIGANTVIPMYFNESLMALQITGSYRTSDSSETYTVRWNSATIVAGSLINRQKIIMMTPDGKYHGIVSGTSTAANSKTISTQKFLLGSPILYLSQTSNVEKDESPASVTTLYSAMSIGTNSRYFLNKHSGWTPHMPVYLKGTVDSDGLFTLAGAGTISQDYMTQQLPTTEDGFVYIMLGVMYTATTSMRLITEHPIIQFKGGALRNYFDDSRLVTSINAMNGDVNINGSNILMGAGVETKQLQATTVSVYDSASNKVDLPYGSSLNPEDYEVGDVIRIRSNSPNKTWVNNASNGAAMWTANPSLRLADIQYGGMIGYSGILGHMIANHPAASTAVGSMGRGYDTDFEMYYYALLQEPAPTYIYYEIIIIQEAGEDYRTVSKAIYDAEDRLDVVETQLPITKGTVSGSGNVVTDITVSGKSVGITKGITAANNNEVVKLSGAQTIAGEKTFNDGIIIPGSNKYIDLGNKNNWFWTRFSGENWSFNNTYTGGGWARNLMEMKDAEGNAYLRIGAQGNSQSFSQMYIGPAYNNYWLSLNNTRALFGTKPQYASDPTDNNDLTRKSYVDDEIDTKIAGKANVTHTHTKSEITDFPTTMTPTAHTHTKSQITDFPTSMPPTAHNHDDRYYTETEVDTKLTGKANVTHTHTKSEITDFPTTMTPTAHNQAYTTINNVPSGRVLGRNSSGTGPTEAITYANLKSYLSLNNVENKSSATIRGEITKSNVTNALEFTPADENEVTPKLANVVLVTATQTVPNTAANTVYVKTGTGAYTLTLAAGAPIGTQISIVLRRTGNLSIARAGSELINGSSTTMVLNGVNTAVTLVKYDATNWACIGV